MATSALASLPQDWQSWIRDNLARGCDPGDMAGVMVRDGKFDSELARAAIEEASAPRRAQVKRQPMPEIDTAANIVQTPDRTVEILMTLRSPRIVLLGNVLSGEECDELVAYGERRLERSPVVDDSDGRMQLHAHRTSQGAMLQRGESPLVARLEARLAALTRWPTERGEGLQLLRYEQGNEYRPHFDWFDASLPGPRKHLESGGQRLATVIMYLTGVEQGGATSFPKLGLQVQPKKGSAVFFANTDPFGTVEQQALHGGEPVMRGVKFIATKWLRERIYGSP